MAQRARDAVTPGASGHPLVAAPHLSPKPGNVAANLLLAGRSIAKAKRARSKVRWVVLPELFTSGYADLPNVRRHAEDARRGPSARFFVSLARRLGIYVACGFPERRRGDPGGVSDSANFVGPRGVMLTYRKTRLVCTTGEPAFFVPGDELPVVRVGGLRVALVICWDLGFPEVVREAALKGVGLVLAPAGWRDPWGQQYGLACAARALYNGVYLASANQLGDYPDARFGARSGVYGPDGSRISISTNAAADVGEIDPDLPRRWRASFGSTLPEHREARPPHALAKLIRFWRSQRARVRPSPHTGGCSHIRGVRSLSGTFGRPLLRALHSRPRGL